MKKILCRFSKFEIALWLSSVIIISVSFVLFDRESYLTLFASLLGVTSLIFCAKGNMIGQVLMIAFCLLYAFISYTFSYYGEMLTYLGMSLPMAIVALISWLKNPYEENSSEVRVSSVEKKHILFMLVSAVFVTLIFYFILKRFGTANLLPSTLSVTTSYMAVYLCSHRSPFFAMAYALNDVVLIVLWTLAATSDLRYVSVVSCFIAFLFNDIYGFINWQKMKKRQNLTAKK